VRARQRVNILLVRTIHARAEEPQAIRPDDFARREENLEFVDGRFGFEIEFTNGPILSGAGRINTHWLVASARPDFIQVRPMPQREIIERRLLAAETLVKPAADTAAAHPDRIALEAQPIPARDGREELAPTVAARIAEN